MIQIVIKQFTLKKVVQRQHQTAGLHFTDELLTEIKNKGVNIAFVTLHVGLGTFRPVSVDDVNDHEMHSEYYQMTQETADLLNDTKSKGHRIISVGYNFNTYT